MFPKCLLNAGYGRLTDAAAAWSQAQRRQGRPNSHTHTRIHTLTDVFTHSHMYSHTRTCIHTRTYVFTHAHMYTCTHAHMNTHTYRSCGRWCGPRHGANKKDSQRFTLAHTCIHTLTHKLTHLPMPRRVAWSQARRQQGRRWAPMTASAHTTVHALCRFVQSTAAAAARSLSRLRCGGSSNDVFQSNNFRDSSEL
jgi:hypothetical protein